MPINSDSEDTEMQRLTLEVDTERTNSGTSSVKGNLPRTGYTVKQILAMLSYGASSMAIILFNKCILSVYNFRFPALMTFSHMFACFGLSLLFREMGWISFPPFDPVVAKKLAPVSIAFVMNVVIGLSALRVVNVPMFTTLRRLSAVFVIILEYAFFNRRPTNWALLSVCTMIGGAIMAGWGDIGFDLISYSYVIANNLGTAAYLIFMKRLDAIKDLNAFGKTFYNSINAMPFLFSIAVLNGEFSTVKDFPYLYDPIFVFYYIGSMILSFWLNYAVFWCTEQTKPLTTSVVGQTKNVLVTFLSIFLFEAIPANFLLITGLSIAATGSVMYSRDK